MTAAVLLLVSAVALCRLYLAYVGWLDDSDLAVSENADIDGVDAQNAATEQSGGNDRSWTYCFEALIRYAVPLTGISRVNFVRLEETQSERRKVIDDTELRMTDREYEDYSRNKFSPEAPDEALVIEKLKHPDKQLAAMFAGSLSRNNSTRSKAEYPNSLAAWDDDGGFAMPAVH